MTCSIFIRSYEKDFPWLQYCLRSLAKYATGFSEIVIAVPEGQQHALKHLTRERVVAVHDGQPGYLCQQADKLNADRHCKGDFILHVDSDTIITKPITPETFMEGDKARWLMTPMAHMPYEVKKAWLHVCVKTCHVWPEYEFMRKVTVMVPRWAYGEFRKFIQNLHGQTMESWVMNQPNMEFSEYNTLGLFLWTYHRDKIHWHDCSVNGVPDPWEHQGWSWGGLNDEIRGRLEHALA